MLYDNAKLLKAYYHLLQITEDAITKEVVSKTLAFIEENWYDPKGGFYGNSDVHGEDAYYGKNPRTLPKPRVEETKYTNWNAEAILTYLYIWETSKDEKFKIMASDTLDFFAKEMVSKEGAFHYEKDGEKGITGNLLDNAYLLLAFTEGYTVLGEEKYLDVGEQLADYSLDNLYDWHSGGFFERNSKDTDNYAPGEHIVLSKPNEENGIIAYALLTLYKQTGNKLYLNAGLKTMGSKLNGIGSLDQGYYYIKAAQLIRQDGLLADFARLEEEITTIEKEKQEDFWLDDILSDEFRVSDTGVEKLKGPFLLLILIALFAGLISFMSPCTLPILPAYLAYSFKSSQKNIKGMTLMFFAGLLMVFTLLGLSATIIGSFLKGNSALFSKIAGVIIIGLGVFILSGKGFKNLGIKKERPATYLGSFLFGTVMGISWSPCVDPILIALLLLASTTGSFITGGLLLFIYGIGLALPLIVLSFYISKINKEGWLWKMIKGKGIEIELSDNRTFFIHSSSLISGVLFIILGYLIFSGTLFAFNQYIASTKFQAIIFKLEEYILGLIGR